MDDATLRLWEIAGNWLSGIGSLGAAVVALYLGLRTEAVKLAVRAGLRIVMREGSDAKPEYLSIGVVNLSQRDVIVKNVGWRMGLIRKRYWVRLLHLNALSSKLPAALAPGEEATWLNNMARELNGRWSGLSAWTLKVEISTTVGKTIVSRIESGLRKKLVEARRTLAANPKPNA